MNKKQLKIELLAAFVEKIDDRDLCTHLEAAYKYRITLWDILKLVGVSEEYAAYDKRHTPSRTAYKCNEDNGQLITKQDRDDHVIKLYNDGLTYLQIAKRIGSTERSIISKASRLRKLKLIGYRNGTNERSKYSC